MPLGGLSLVAPGGLLLCFLALLPAGVLALAGRRQRRVARELGLRPGTLWRMVAGASLAAGTCVALGVAAAQPVLTTTGDRSARTSSEVVFVVDVSTSMSAAERFGAASRLERARAVVSELRAAVPDVPAGLSGLTDRLLPYVFPTLDTGVFSATLAHSVQVDAPPPQEVSTVATTFEALTSLLRDGFYTAGKDHRTCVLVTDGETRADTAAAGRLAGRGGCRLVSVRVGGPADRIFRRDGTVKAAYRPEVSAATTVERLARLSGGSAFGASEVGAAAAAVKAAADVGPEERVGFESTRHPLAPLFSGLAAAGVAILLWRVFGSRSGRLPRARKRRYDAATEA